MSRHRAAPINIVKAARLAGMRPTEVNALVASNGLTRYGTGRVVLVDLAELLALRDGAGVSE